MATNTKKLIDDKFRWKNVVKPLAEFLNNPVIAKDRENEYAANTLLLYVDTLKRHITLKQEIETIQQQNEDIKILLNQKEQYINELLNTIQFLQKNLLCKIWLKFQNVININKNQG